MPIPNPKGRHSISGANKKADELRMALIAIEHAMGQPLSRLAEKYHCSRAEVKRTLDVVAESGFLDHYRALTYDQLAPKALAVYEAQLALGNLEAARDILFGLGVLQKDGASANRMKEKLIDSLDAWREARRVRQLKAPIEVPDATLQ